MDGSEMTKPVGIPEGATHKMNGSFYIKKDQDFYDVQAGRIPVMSWDGAEWSEAFLNDDAPLVEIEAEHYKPAMGELCEAYFRHDGWCKRYYLGFTRGEEHVLESFNGSISLHSSEHIRHIKNERAKFIEQALEVIETLNGVTANKEQLGILFDNGARFKGSNDE